MLKNVLLIGSALLAASTSVAQSEIEWGEVHSKENDNDDVQTIAFADGGFCTLEYAPPHISGKHFTAKICDARGKKIKQARFRFESQSAAFIAMRPQIERLIEVGGRRYFLLKEIDPKTQKINLYGWEFDPLNLVIANEPAAVASVDYRDYHFSSYLWTLNHEKNLLYVLEFPGKGKSPAAELILKEYDKDLKLLDEKKFMLPPSMEFLKITSFSIDRGNLVISAIEYEDRPPIIGRKMPAFRVVYFFIRPTEGKIQVIPIELPGAVAHHTKYTFEGADKFLCFGLFSKSDSDLSSGAFLLRYDMKAQQLAMPEMRAFPPDILAMAARTRNGFKRQRDDAVPNLKVRDIFFRQDGGTQFIAEQSDNYWLNYTTGNFDGSMETTVSGTVFKYDDIMIYTLYDDPSRDWFSLIRKRQSALGTDRDFSFAHRYDQNGTLRLFYNDLPENLSITEDDEPSNLKGGKNRMVTVLAEVEPGGKVARQVLFTRKEVGHWFAPRQTLFDADGNIFLTAFDSKTYRIGKFTLMEKGDK